MAAYVPCCGFSAARRCCVGSSPLRQYQKSRSPRAGADDGRGSGTLAVHSASRLPSAENSGVRASLANVRGASPGVAVPSASTGAPPCVSATISRKAERAPGSFFTASSYASGSLNHASDVPSGDSTGDTRCATPCATVVSSPLATSRTWTLSSVFVCTTYATCEPSALTAYAETLATCAASASPSRRIASDVGASLPGPFGALDAAAAGDAEASGAADPAAAGDDDACGDADGAGDGDGDGSSRYASVVPSRASTNERTRSTAVVRAFATSARSVIPSPSFGR